MPHIHAELALVPNSSCVAAIALAYVHHPLAGTWLLPILLHLLLFPLAAPKRPTTNRVALHSVLLWHSITSSSTHPDPHTPCLLMPAGVTRTYLRAACYPRDRTPYPAALSNSALFQSRSEKYTKVLWKMVFPVLTAGKSAFNPCCPWSLVSKVCQASVTGHSIVSTSPGYEDIPWGRLLVIAFWK